MKLLKIEMENCYGIKSLKTEISFSKKKANIVYAPNGIMKTSFAQSFKDLSEKKESRDRVYKDRITKRIVTDENCVEIPAEQVFVIEPYAPSYESSKISTLLVNKELKIEYDKILLGIDDKKEILVKELKKYSGLKNNIEEVISNVFTMESNKTLIALSRVEKEVLEEDKSELSTVVYSQIFNEKVEAFLNTKDFKNKLEAYTKTYDNLLSSSTFFKKGVFNHFQASEITKNLKTHGFFKADHSVYLNSNGVKSEIKNEQELEQVINKEKELILSNPELQKTFNEIDEKLTTQDLRQFREYLLNNQIILPELVNLELFKQKLWKAYLIERKDLFIDLMNEYNKGKARIQEIAESASAQATKWQEVINIFNRRFSVPFKVSIENKQDVILKSVTPNVKFEFIDDSGISIPVERNELISVLSNGEKRALYKESDTKTLFIVDDIADSFDYKNKYAIIEYLNDMLDNENFFQIILTHNYDFYRTVSGRLELGGARYHTVKTKDSVSFDEDRLYKEPFSKWKNNLHDKNKREILVAMIPFVRNLAEYCGREKEESKLTSLLHIKEDTNSIKIKELYDLIYSVLNITDATEIDAPAMSVKDMIYLEADKLSKENFTMIELEKKIALSIAIRLKTEDFLIKKINDSELLKTIKGNQTARLYKEFKKKFSNDTAEINAIKLVERVNLMTPENIHLNSFMYEPILDLSNDHLKQLYLEVSTLDS
jgi:hypothetical protein